MPKPSAEKRRLVSNFEIKPIYHEKFLIDSFGLDMHKYKHAQAQVQACMIIHKCKYKQILVQACTCKYKCVYAQVQTYTCRQTLVEVQKCKHAYKGNMQNPISSMHKHKGKLAQALLQTCTSTSASLCINKRIKMSVVIILACSRL